MRNLLLIALLLGFARGGATNYYLSGKNGDDAADGRTPTTAWKSLLRLAILELQPGDSLLFRAGDRFTGAVLLDHQGRAGRQIVLSRYGEGDDPLLDGEGNEYVLKLLNPAHLTIERLRITNWEGRYGIRFEAEDAGEMRDVHFRQLNLFRIGERSMTVAEPSKTDGAISGRVWRGSRPSWWNGLTFRDITIQNVGSCGITFGNEVKLYDRPSAKAPYYKPHQNVVIERCHVDSTARDGIWIRQCDGARVQYNTVAHTGMNSIANGIWFWDCLNSVMQFNEGWECLSVRGNDGAPFSIDNHCRNCVIQYNYSHDNEGPGYMIFGRGGDGRGNIVRHNLSYNDNTTRTYKTGTAAISLVSEVRDAVVTDNIVVAGRETHYLLGHRFWEGWPVSVRYERNTFFGNGLAPFSNTEKIMWAATFRDNLFINVPDLPETLSSDTDPQSYLQAAARLRSSLSDRINDEPR